MTTFVFFKQYWINLTLKYRYSLHKSIVKKLILLLWCLKREESAKKKKTKLLEIVELCAQLLKKKLFLFWTKTVKITTLTFICVHFCFCNAIFWMKSQCLNNETKSNYTFQFDKLCNNVSPARKCVFCLIEGVFTSFFFFFKVFYFN